MNLITKISITLISASLLSYAGFRWYTKHKISKEQLFATQKPARKDLEQFVTATGSLKAKDEISVGSLITGRVVELRADDNDVVKKHQILAVLDDGVGVSDVKRLTGVLREQEATYKYQTLYYNRQKALFNVGHISQDTFDKNTRDLDNSLGQFEQARYDLEMAQKRYENLFVRAPTDGTVTAREVNLGQQITAALQATELFKLAVDLKHIEADISVDEADVGLVKSGQEATFTVDAYPEREFKGKVAFVKYFAQIVESVVTYPTVLYIQNDDLALRPQMTTNASIKVIQAKNALCVPNKALRINKTALEAVAKTLKFEFNPLSEPPFKKQIDHVWVFENGNSFKQVKVQLGANERNFTQITSGITDDTLVVTEVYEEAKISELVQHIVGGAKIGK